MPGVYSPLFNGPALEASGLKPVSIHLDSKLVTQGNPDDLDGIFARLKQRGFAYAVFPYLPEPERGFVLELQIPLRRPGSTWRVLAACRHQSGSVGRDVIESVKTRLPEVPADVALVFATPDFTAEAVTAAQEAGVALLRLVDGRSAFDMSGWSTPGHYPAWLPAYLPQLIDRDIAGQPRARLLEAGRVDMLLDCLAPR